MRYLMSWEDHARCIRYDPDLFFAPRARAERRAKEICSDCPVQAECLDYALAIKVEFGIWGGTNGKERRVMLLPAARLVPTLEPAFA
jgi:WhiB family redox-sensing transcriptional regulator